MTAQIDWRAQEHEARTANDMVAPPAAVAAGRQVDRILWNRGRETVDEIVVHNCTVHLEQMTDTHYWMGVYKGDGSLHVNLHHSGRKPLLCTAYDDGPVDWPWDADEEHL